jgi:hypothetical protein
MWRCNIRDVLIKNVKNKQQNLKRIPVIRNRALKIYQDIWPFQYKAPEALRKMKMFSYLQGETILMTPLFDEMFSDFDDHHKQLRIKQKNDNFQGKKQTMFNFKQVISEEEAKEVFDILLSTKQKMKSNETRNNQIEFGRNQKIQITTYLFLTSSNKKCLQKNLKIMFKKINHTQFRNITNIENQIKSKLTTEAERRKINFNLKQGILSKSLKQLNQVAVTEKIALNLCSNQEAAPERKQKQTENMSNIIQDETIPMAFPSFFLYQLNNHSSEENNNNYLSINFYLLEELFRSIRRNNLPTQVAEPNQLKKKFLVKFLEKFLEKFYQKRRIHQEREAERHQSRIVNQKCELEFLFVNLIV